VELRLWGQGGRGWLSKLVEPRSSRQVEQEVSEELDFHLAEASSELEASGMSPSEARNLARARFGDYERIRADCLREQTRQLIMIRRIHLVFTAVLIVTVAALGISNVQAKRRYRSELMQRTEESLHYRARLADLEQAAWAPLPPGTAEPEAAGGRRAVPAEAPGAPNGDAELSTAEWLARFQAQPDDWHHGLEQAYRLARLPDERAAVLARELWPKLSVPHREQFFKPFVFDGGRKCALEVLELGAFDPAPSVRSRANTYLLNYAFQDFGEDPAAAEAWFASAAGRPAGEVVAASARRFAQRLAQSAGDDLARLGRLLADVRTENAAELGVDLGQEFTRAGLGADARGWLAAAQPEERALAARALALMAPHDPRLRADLIQAADDDEAEVSDVALAGLGRAGEAWACRPLLDWLARRGGSQEFTGASYSAASALATIGDPAVVPELIELMARQPGGELDYSIGHYALRELTGVAYDKSHDAAWWQGWLAQHGPRFGWAAPAHAAAPEQR
jgi:hypothetical protein